MRKLLLLLILSATLGSGAGIGSAQSQRQLPQKAERGVTGQSLPLPMIEIDGKPLRLAAGGIIFDENNRTIVHAHVPVGAAVLYTVDSAGYIQRLFVLTTTEQARLDQAGR